MWPGGGRGEADEIVVYLINRRPSILASTGVSIFPYFPLRSLTFLVLFDYESVSNGMVNRINEYIFSIFPQFTLSVTFHCFEY